MNRQQKRRETKKLTPAVIDNYIRTESRKLEREQVRDEKTV